MTTSRPAPWEANAIRALIRQAAKKSGRLKYVLLIGDDTPDVQDYLGWARSASPVSSRWDGAFGRVASENCTRPQR